ncbi:DUF4169 family protein [Methylobacterium sp. sgz302541]|uniref:DUF4169 family protein n=1 Tax=unclassified Methylobacterium TaxID=2615210 RepID=UPI003D33676D
MAEIINLKQWRKARELAEKKAQAAANRATFGRTKSAKTVAEARKRAEAARLEGHRLGEDDPKA